MLREALTEIMNALGVFKKKRNLIAARNFVAANTEKKDVENAPDFHLTAPIGWLNDPNGFSFFKDKFHLFYQYHPYSNYWGPMHWGHAVSDDLIAWEHKPVALAPDSPSDKGGAWSGSAIERDGKLYLMYSGDCFTGQVQNIAWSENGDDYIKYENNPVIGKDKLPEGGTIINFRDPKIWESGGVYYAVIATKVAVKPAIVRYKSADIMKWDYDGVLYSFADDYVRECPDYFELDGRKVLLYSSKSGENLYMIGREEEGRFIPDGEPEPIDYGPDFYAPQTTEHNGRRIMSAWMQSWGRDIPSREYNYAGMMIIPRELTLKDGKLNFAPVKELESYREEKTVIDKAINASTAPTLLCRRTEYADILIRAEFPEGGDLLLSFMRTEETNEDAEIYLTDSALYLNRANIKRKISKGAKKDNFFSMPIDSGTKELRIIIDKYAIEVFSGGKSLSATAYPEGKEYAVTVSAKSGAHIKADIYWLRRL